MVNFTHRNVTSYSLQKIKGKYLENKTLPISFEASLSALHNYISL